MTVRARVAAAGAAVLEALFPSPARMAREELRRDARHLAKAIEAGIRVFPAATAAGIREARAEAARIPAIEAAFATAPPSRARRDDPPA